MLRSIKQKPANPEEDKGNEVTATLTTKDRFTAWQQTTVSKHWRFAISAACSAIAASAVALDLGIVNLLERQVQSLFFEIRGPVAPPENVVILAIDDESMSQGQHYLDDPGRYKALQPIESWPWQRQAYARVINRLMEAGADAVALDLLFTAPSTYGPADDEAFATALEQYGDQVVLAADYGDVAINQGALFDPNLPLPRFENTGVRIGSINFKPEFNGKIHRLGQDGLTGLTADKLGIQREAVATVSAEDAPPLSFAQATLLAAGQSYPDQHRENIFFHGPNGTFEQIPFWYVLDDDPWRNKLKSGAALKDKIVVIGTTAVAHQDFHEAPFSGTGNSMAGVEILANTIATLQGDLSPQRLIQRPTMNALGVLVLGLTIAAITDRSQRPLQRAMVAGSGLGLWALVSYFAFVAGQTIVLAGVPIVAIATMGLLDFGVGFTADRLKRKRLRTTLARYATSPLIQEIISQQDDFQDLLELHRADIIGKLLRDRYRIMEVLGAGGFGETYLAQDTMRPGNPVCVVKQLKIVSDNPKSHRLAQRLFEAEAVVLGQLGEHDQIPRLLAYFEVQQSFYLVQEMIQGQLLRNVLSRSRPLSQRAVVAMLLDLLPVISFVHSRGVIHRDIKPSNIIRRKADSRYVLIDFGAVKTISNKLVDSATQVTSTVGIGTQGYMPSEQSAGMPTVRSDLYALGITAIEALTGRPPHALKHSDDGEVIWSHTIDDMSPELARIINKMVRYDFNKRYHSAQDVFDELKRLDESKITDSPATQKETQFPDMDEQTFNQGTRPGVIETNPELENTQILSDGWFNEQETEADKTSEATTDEIEES